MRTEEKWNEVTIWADTYTEQNKQGGGESQDRPHSASGVGVQRWGGIARWGANAKVGSKRKETRWGQNANGYGKKELLFI